MNEPIKPKRPHGLAAFGLVMAASAALGGLAGIGAAFLQDLPSGIDLAVTMALVSATMAAGVLICAWWWRGIDEAAREAHKWAWWWGGTGGIAIGAVLLVTLTLTDDPTALLPKGVGPAPIELFAAGMVSILLFQLAGYTLAWAGWWLKHR